MGLALLDVPSARCCQQAFEVLQVSGLMTQPPRTLLPW